MIEFPDEAERREALSKMLGIEVKVWVMVDGHDKVFPVADEDLERETETKTSSVHFLRFELTPAMVSALKSGASLSAGIDHPAYSFAVAPVAANIRDSLVSDLD